MLNLPVLFLFSVILFNSGQLAHTAEQDTVIFTVSPESEVYYTADVRIALVATSTVRGVNNEVSGTIEWIETDSRPFVNAHLTIDASKFDSGNSTRDNDVRDILNVEEYPEITFELSTILGLGDEELSNLDGEYVAAGHLTAHGVTNEMSVPVTIKYANGSLTVEGSVATSYTAFGIDPPRVAGFVSRAPDELRLHVSLIAVKVNY